MDRARITEALRTATEIIDEVLPWELGPRNRSMADRTELRKAALPPLFTALLSVVGPDHRQQPVTAPPAPGDDGGELITAAEAAAILGVKTGSAVIEWATRGLLPAAHTPGGRWRFRRHDIEELRATGQARALPRTAPVPIGDIITMREDEGLSWRQMSMRTGKSGGSLSNRYRQWKKDHGTGRATVIHLTNPDVLAGNTELADADGHGWQVRDIPDDGRHHPRGKPCPACSLDTRNA